MNASLVLDGQTVRLTPRAARMAIMLARHAISFESLTIGHVGFDIARGRIVLKIEQSAEMLREEGA